MKKHFYTLILLLLVLLPGGVFAVGSLNTEESSARDFILNADDAAGDVALSFGGSLGKYLQWNDGNSWFEINDDLSLSGNQLIDFRVDNQGVAPTCDSGAAGKMYFDTDDNRNYFCDGTSWMSTNTQQQQIVGRSYFYSDARWVTWSHTTYGLNYHQWNQSGGTGTNPVVPWSGVGMWFPKGTRIVGITFSGRSNNIADISDIETAWEFRYPDPITRWETGLDNSNEDIHDTIYRNLWVNTTDIDQPAFSGNLNDVMKRDYVVDYTTPEDGFLDQVLKPVRTGTSTHYFYSSTTITYILPGA